MMILNRLELGVIRACFLVFWFVGFPLSVLIFLRAYATYITEN